MEEMKIENEVATEETTVDEQEEGKSKSGLAFGLELFGIGALIGGGGAVGGILTEKVIIPGVEKVFGFFKNRKKKVSKKEETNEDDYLYDENDEFEKADE